MYVAADLPLFLQCIYYTILLYIVIDIDECGLQSDNCTINETCLNMPDGTFACNCKSGYAKANDSKHCEGMFLHKHNY